METENPQNKKKKVIWWFIYTLGAFLVLSALGYGSFRIYHKYSLLKLRSDEVAYSVINNDAYRQSLLKNNPGLIQSAFLFDVQNNVNDKFTKSDAYFITHRYFDNGGNIYEIYNYVESHEELAFLKEAEGIYPDIFEQIRGNAIPMGYSNAALYAFLAYLEILDRHGYADLASLGTAANQYAKLAYFSKVQPEQFSNDEQASRTKDLNISRSIVFAKKSHENLIQTLRENDLSASDLNGTLSEVKMERFGNLVDTVPHNFLVGINQYAASLRYLEAAGIDISAVESTVFPRDMFAFSMIYSKKFVPELEQFTSLLNASTLSLVSPNDVSGIRAALKPILKLGKMKKPEGIQIYFVKAKSEKKVFIEGTNTQKMNLDIYGKKNFVTLASIVPEFKAWLIKNGWNEVDFH